MWGGLPWLRAGLFTSSLALTILLGGNDPNLSQPAMSLPYWYLPDCSAIEGDRYQDETPFIIMTYQWRRGMEEWLSSNISMNSRWGSQELTMELVLRYWKTLWTIPPSYVPRVSISHFSPITVCIHQMITQYIQYYHLLPTDHRLTYYNNVWRLQ